MTTIEKLLNTIEALEEIANQALDLVNEYSGGESETADEIRGYLAELMETHHADD
jgi:hypothetical protein